MHPEVENLWISCRRRSIFSDRSLSGSLVGIFFAFHMTDILDAMIIFNYPYMEAFHPAGRSAVEGRATRKSALLRRR